MSAPIPSFRTTIAEASRLTSPPAMRPYYTMSYSPADRAVEREVLAPATPDFEAAFNAFAHGTLLATADGPVAIEDLRPGMEVLTRERGAQKVLWIGIMTHRTVSGPDALLTRVTSDRFGQGQPHPDLLAGPGARMLHRPAASHSDPQGRLIYSPLRDFIDGDSVIGIRPRMAVETYHLALHHHATIIAAGLDLESFHPGTDLCNRMGPHTLDLYLTIFPHVRRLTDFGQLAHPRMSARNVGTREYV
ncbi:Hint domain-containing protein [Pseudooceanicola sp. C21-150M6]|uniref:Hint domain-containing protein n=1 Tax=Pseudooceanicola sp. C21-150M6 TaxID=3434355 RepID=UPI003D7F2438